MLQIMKGGAWREITACNIRASGAWRSLVQIKIFKGGAWRTVANFTGGGGPMSIALSATAMSATGHSPVTSATVTATPSGGLAPYTYAWSIVSEDRPGTNTINSPTHATTTVTESGIAFNAACVLHCVVTDSLGDAATSDPVTISFSINR